MIDPAPRSLLGFGPKVPDLGRRRRPKDILLLLVEGEKEGFHPMCLYSKYSTFLAAPTSGRKPNWTKYEYQPCAEVCRRWAIP